MAVPKFKVSESMKENPFYYDDIDPDEYLMESAYYGDCIVHAAQGDIWDYKPLMQQLRDGDIERLPEKYKKYCLNPDWDKDLYEHLKK